MTLPTLATLMGQRSVQVVQARGVRAGAELTRLAKWGLPAGAAGDSGYRYSVPLFPHKSCVDFMLGRCTAITGHRACISCVASCFRHDLLSPFCVSLGANILKKDKRDGVHH